MCPITGYNRDIEKGTFYNLGGVSTFHTAHTGGNRWAIPRVKPHLARTSLIGKDQHAREKNQAGTLHGYQWEEGGRKNRQGHAGTSSQGGTRVGTLRLDPLFRFLWWICFLLLAVLLCYVPLAQSRAGGNSQNQLFVTRAHGHRGRSLQGTPPAVACGALKAALSWPAVIPALAADICSSFCTVSVSCTARA